MCFSRVPCVISTLASVSWRHVMCSGDDLHLTRQHWISSLSLILPGNDDDSHLKTATRSTALGAAGSRPGPLDRAPGLAQTLGRNGSQDPSYLTVVDCTTVVLTLSGNDVSWEALWLFRALKWRRKKCERRHRRVSVISRAGSSLGGSSARETYFSSVSFIYFEVKTRKVNFVLSTAYLFLKTFFIKARGNRWHVKGHRLLYSVWKTGY